MGAHAIQDTNNAEQLALYDRSMLKRAERRQRGRADSRRMCAACQAHEARYGFRDREDDDPLVGRPSTLCFDCFRMELDRRHDRAEQLARGWNARQESLPLAGKLDALNRRRRRAQIAARHALELG